MEHLNYCRQMVKQFTKALSIPNFPADSRKMLSQAINLSNVAQKFLLPDGGRLYDDPEYRALDETQSLRLPYPVIALEYSRRCEINESERILADQGYEVSSKAILFAREQGDLIVLTPMFWINDAGIWGPAPEAALPRVGYLDRSNVVRGHTAVKMMLSNDLFPLSDYADEVGSLLCFLNVLQCKNVNVERSDSKSCSKKVKAALPFDSYHILTVNVQSAGSVSGKQGCSNAHRSPREHLRRGHIRRLEDGRRIWVNATVVAASSGSGMVGKDYRVMA